MRFFQIVILLLVGLGLLVGCAFLEQPTQQPISDLGLSPSPTVSETPTADGSNLPVDLPPLNEPGSTPSLVPPSRTPRPTATILTPTATTTPTITRTPTLTPTITPTPTLNPKAILLRIAEPGPMSKVISPIEFVAHISPDFVGSTRIELIGEDGRTLFSKSFRTFATETTTKVSQKVDFEIHGVAEVARLQISTFDKNGQMKAFNSVRLLLLSVGENELTPPYLPIERALLRTPKWGDKVSGGVLDVQGEMRPVNDLPVVMELYTASGGLLGSRILGFAHDTGEYQPFNASIPYQVNEETPARLVIHQDDDRIGGLAYLYSTELQIAP